MRKFINKFNNTYKNDNNINCISADLCLIFDNKIIRNNDNIHETYHIIKNDDNIKYI